MKKPADFLKDAIRLVLKGHVGYYAWMGVWSLLLVLGILAYVNQARHGLITTGMRDQVSWGFYIGNFTFLVGVAAAAVMLVIPAYVYKWKPIKDIVVVGELLAVAAIVMCILFVMVDVGRPERVWEFIPFLGRPNWPRSMLTWDVLVLNFYLFLNLLVAGHMIYRMWQGRDYSKSFILPLVLISIPAAVSIHTVTAFLYCGLAARPFWNAAILAPRFLASAFCSGPALILIVLQVLRKTTRLQVKDEALWKIAEIMTYTMFINLFFLASELFKDFYSSTHHVEHMRYLFFGIEGHDNLVPFTWASLSFSLVAFLIYLVPRTRTNLVTMNLGAVLIFLGVYLEKGLNMVLPGFTPSVLGEFYEYVPTRNEVMISAGVLAMGVLVYTVLLKVAVPILKGEVDQVLGRA